MLLLALAGLAGAPLFGQAAPAGDDFVVVEADLEGQLFTSVLPFDVPFILTGAVPDGVTTLEVRCWKLDTDPASRRPLLRSREDLARNPQDGACFGGQALTWSNTVEPSAPSPKFRLLVPRLDGEAFYQFKFSAQKKVTADEAKAFVQRIDADLDAFLWGDPRSGAELPVSGDLTRAETPGLRAAMIAELKAAAGADRVVEEGSVFNPDTPVETVHDTFSTVLAPVRDAQSKIDRLAENYEDEVTVLNPRLATLATDPALTRLGSALAGRAAGDPTFKPLADDVAAALAVPPAPVLGKDSRAGAAALSTFVETARAALAASGPAIADLRGFLAGRPAGEEGSLETQLAPLVAASALTAEDVAALRALGAPTGLVGSIDRAVNAQPGAAQSRIGLLLGQLDNQLGTRAAALLAVVEDIRLRAENTIVIAGNTTGSFATQSKNYIGADTGVLCAPELDDCTTYVGTNLYFGPVNKAAPLNQFGPFFSRESLKRRVSVTIGLTVDGVADGGKTRDDLLNNQSLVLGLGARLSNSVRLTAGGLLFKKLDPNPLVDDETLTTSWFLSVSFDIDVARSIQGIGTLFR